MAQWLRALVALLENTGSIPGLCEYLYGGSQSFVTPVLGLLIASSLLEHQAYM